VGGGAGVAVAFGAQEANNSDATMSSDVTAQTKDVFFRIPSSSE
jgi:hypothetical protein